ncbi:uncharacterized protein TRIADDRAFT_60019 [Trichoplax adhaerens]|uniref:Protein Wnt n=1 Tax=Trichoplax adhaerens TaxID=10228 RepID=B3S731_TRIAD|nr:predicted protein [Trichoplax adhaerens]EDV21499.1 predicted protein [Trichoplax adhaerens]|eukprot:XP_002116099.1 predicted protein [Trichoplax adhaerens]
MTNNQQYHSYQLHHMLFLAIFLPYASGSLNPCKLLDLTTTQFGHCKKCPILPELIDNGIKAGIRLCRQKYRFHRWNCKTNMESSAIRFQAIPIGKLRNITYRRYYINLLY